MLSFSGSDKLVLYLTIKKENKVELVNIKRITPKTQSIWNLSISVWIEIFSTSISEIFYVNVFFSSPTL